MNYTYDTLPPVVKDAVTCWYCSNKEHMTAQEVIADINNSTPFELFEKYCEWNGLINMAGELWSVATDLHSDTP